MARPNLLLPVALGHACALLALLSAAASAAPAFLAPPRQLCQSPTPLATTGANILMIGDSISMGSSGYSLFVRNFLQNATNGTLAGSVQHGGGFGGGGQMASSANGAEKVKDCVGNASGTLKPKAWSVITYNAGLHDCDTNERVQADAYAANLKAVFETLKPAASAVFFVTTTPYPMPLVNRKPPLPAGINMSCVIEYNEIARSVVAEVGGVFIDDLYGYVEDFCQAFPTDPDSSDFGHNYTTCAIQSSSLHFFTRSPLPSGQQYTGLSVASEALKKVPEASISNATEGPAPTDEDAILAAVTDCGAPPNPPNPHVPNVLIIGDSISEPGSGYGPGVEAILGDPALQNTGPIAAVQHNGGIGSNQAGPTTNGVQCAKSWVGDTKWDVITFNFGIHDCAPGGDGRPGNAVVPEAEYVANLKQIYAVLHGALAPNGTILWVTTTPISKDAGAKYDGKGPPGWTGFNDCVNQYNAAAASTLVGLPDLDVVDLNAAVTDVCGTGYDECALQLWSNVHFTTAGKQFCAVQVAAGIAPKLGPSWRRLVNATVAR